MRLKSFTMPLILVSFSLLLVISCTSKKSTHPNDTASVSGDGATHLDGNGLVRLALRDVRAWCKPLTPGPESDPQEILIQAPLPSTAGVPAATFQAIARYVTGDISYEGVTLDTSTPNLQVYEANGGDMELQIDLANPVTSYKVAGELSITDPTTSEVRIIELSCRVSP